MGHGDEPTHAGACRAAGTHPTGPHPAAAPRGAVPGCRGAQGVGVPLALAAQAEGASGVRCWQGLSNGQDVPVPSLPRRLPGARPAAGQAEGSREIFLTPVPVSVCPSCEPLQPHTGTAALSLLLLGSAAVLAGRGRPCSSVTGAAPAARTMAWRERALCAQHRDRRAQAPRGRAGELGWLPGARPRGGRCLRAPPAPTLPAGTPTSVGG